MEVILNMAPQKVYSLHPEYSTTGTKGAVSMGKKGSVSGCNQNFKVSQILRHHT